MQHMSLPISAQHVDMNLEVSHRKQSFRLDTMLAMYWRPGLKIDSMLRILS